MKQLTQINLSALFLIVGTLCSYAQSDTVISKNITNDTVIKQYKIKDKIAYEKLIYNSQGKLYQKVDLKPNGKCISIVIDVKTGKLKQCSECIYDKTLNICFEGKDISYYSNGKIFYEGYYKNNKMNGLFIYYNENGNIIRKENYQNNELSGNYCEYSPESKTVLVIGKYYKNNKIGEWKEYYPKGIIKSKGVYLPERIVIQSFTKQQVDSIQNIVGKIPALPFVVYKKDKKWEYYAPNGDLIKNEVWNKGILIK